MASNRGRKLGIRDLRNGQLSKTRQGAKNKELRRVTDPVIQLSNLNGALSIESISKVHRDGPRVAGTETLL